LRLTRKGIDAGIVADSQRIDMLQDRETAISKCLAVLKQFTLPRHAWVEAGEGRSEFHMSQGDGKHKSALEILSMPDVQLNSIVSIINKVGTEELERLQRSDNATQKNIQDATLYANFQIPAFVFDTTEAEGKYFQYIDRQEVEMERWKRSKSVLLPVDMVYNNATFPSFSNEELELFNKFRPVTLHAASQIQGITPHAVLFLHNYMLKHKHKTTRSKQREEM
jgi:tRNA U34 5-carboxymethylaminomethyl modifying enzyme MnmG/GidA